MESRSQTLRLGFGSAGTGAVDRLRVRIRPDVSSGGWLGQLQIEGSHALEREVRGERCADVALALALIAVLRLDAGARAPEDESPLVPPAERSPDASGNAPSAPGQAPADDVLLPDSAVQIVRSRRLRPSALGSDLDETASRAEPGDDQLPRDSSDASASRSSSAWRPALAAHLGYVSAPSQALQARLRAELQLGPRLQSGSIALGFGYAGASDQNASADLDFALLSAQLDVCPLALGAAPWLRACAALSGGVFAVSAQALDDDLVSQSSTRPWAALGPSLEAGAPLGSGWTLRALAEVSFLLVRDTFEVERIVGDEAGQPSRITRTLLYRPPFGSFAAALGLGYAF